MPYTISVNMPGYLPEQDPYAVATLDEARRAAAEEVECSYDRLDWPSEQHDEFLRGASYWAGECAHIPLAGGTLGPLPCGSVIDVQRVSWTELATLAGYNTVAPRDDLAALEFCGYWGQGFADELIDAYNDRV